MQTSESYIGFPPLPDQPDMVTALLNVPPDVRWRLVRQLFRIKKQQEIVSPLPFKLYTGL
jgi:hypothetical protein